MAQRRFTWIERFSEAIFDFNYAWAERRHKRSPLGYPGGLAAMPADYHAIVPRCAMVAGPCTPDRLAADRMQLRARAARSRRERPALGVTIVVVAAGTFLVAYSVYALIVTLAPSAPKSDPIGTVVVGVGLWLGLAQAIYAFGLGLGRHVAVVHAMQEWAGKLGGDSGIDTVEPVVAWMTEFWPWLSPPNFLARESAWATGWLHGFAVLLISEREDRRIIVAVQDAFARSEVSGREELPEFPASSLCRLSLFVAGANLRKGPGTQPVIDELGALGYGMVTVPMGVYVYGIAYERALHPQRMSPVVEKVMSVLEPVPRSGGAAKAPTGG